MDSIHMIALCFITRQAGRNEENANNNFAFVFVVVMWSMGDEKWRRNIVFQRFSTDSSWHRKDFLLYWRRKQKKLTTIILTTSSEWKSFASYFRLQFILLDVRSFLLNRISIESSYSHSVVSRFLSLFFLSFLFFYSKPFLLFRLLFIAFYISLSFCMRWICQKKKK